MAAEALPAALFVASLGLAGIMYGTIADHFQIFPYSLFKQALTTGRVVWDHITAPPAATNLLDVTTIDASDVKKLRIVPVSITSSVETFGIGI